MPGPSFEDVVLSLPGSITVKELDDALRKEAETLGIDPDYHDAVVSAPTPESCEREQLQVFSATYLEHLRRTQESSSSSSRPAESPLKAVRDVTCNIPLSAMTSPRTLLYLRRARFVLRRLRSVREMPPGSCPSCPHNWSSQCQPEHTLACGHILCTGRAHAIVFDVIKSYVPRAPTCCGELLPNEVIDKVTSAHEKTLLKVRVQHSDVAYQAEYFRRHKSLPGTVLASFGAPSDDIANRPEMKTLANDQLAMQLSFDSWSARIIESIENNHTGHIVKLHQTFDRQLSAVRKRYRDDIWARDDEHAADEYEMRQQHEEELVGIDNAVSQQQAFCDGVLRSGDPHGQPIPDSAFDELDRTKGRYTTLAYYHARAIRLLRENQFVELAALDRECDLDIAQLQHHQAKREAQAEKFMEAVRGVVHADLNDKQAYLKKRWGLEVAVLRKQLEIAQK